MYEKRFYRDWVKEGDLKAFEVKLFETDLLILADRILKIEAEKIVYAYRRDLLDYIDKNKSFKESFKPIEMDEKAPAIAKDMIKKSAIAGVGPMAGIAGAMAEYTARGLLEYSSEIIIENGGDIFMNSAKDRTMSVFAGKSPLSGKIKIRLLAEKMPLGIATSSATVGHSISFGKADAALIISHDAVLADCVATEACNLAKSADDLTKAIDYAKSINGVLGALIILGDKMASWGDIELA
ncbi:MAG: UPF0280 family protein [Candidatus Omnitrophica bacterium]|nr:UPF0280 family protein [Candidatus Omnitrophota bacterium]MBU4487491.1 UPF0280 family protein [Candidatus Omnitrophota bacterium]MCG2704917.1 UPF0280 family protein [Candidatus Omnitrophota bacterium]